MINPSDILDCFGSNFIGVSGIGTAPSSGYYLDNLVSINIEGLAKVASGEDVTGEDFLTRIMNQAIIGTANEFLTRMIRDGKLQYQFSSASCQIALPANRVLKITTRDQLQSIMIDGAEINYNGNIYILDEQGNSTIVDASSGVDFNIHFKGKGRTLYLYVNDSPLSITQASREIRTCVPIKCSCNCFDAQEMQDEGLTGDSTENIFHLRCECSYDSLICSFKNLLAYPIFYHAAGLFMLEKWQSNNIDPFIRGSREYAEAMYYEWLNGMPDKKSKYHELLDASVRAASQMLKDTGSKCIKCEGIKLVNNKM